MAGIDVGEFSGTGAEGTQTHRYCCGTDEHAKDDRARRNPTARKRSRQPLRQILSELLIKEIVDAAKDADEGSCL